jgi:lysophospholipase L1-like esterase
VSLRDMGKNILAVLIGISLSLVLFEGLLRIFQPIEYRVKGRTIKLPRDKKYNFINDKTDKLDRVISTSWNHMGFRGEMPPKKFSACLTIIAVGGSTTECTNISDGKTWCDLLAKELKEKFRPVWLGNAGLNGMSTYGHLISMEDYLITIKPKVVLFLVGANDIGLTTYRDGDRDHFKKPVAGWLASGWEKILNRSEVLGYAINFYRYSRASSMGLTQPIFNFAELKQIDISPEKVQALLREHQEKYLPGYEARLNKLIEISRAHGIEPVFITQPMVFGDLIDPYTGINLSRRACWLADGKTMWRLLELYNDVTRHTCRQHHVQVIDLAGKMPKSTEFYYDTYHFTNAGCRQVAELVYRDLSPVLEKQFPQYIRSTTKP